MWVGLCVSLCPPIAAAQTDWVARWTFFDPATHGWSFPNDRFKVCMAPTCIPENTVGTFGHRFLLARWALCGGMSLSALRRFREGKNIEPFSPSLKDHELVPAQLETVAAYGNTFVEWDRRPNQGSATDPYHSMEHEVPPQWRLVKAAIDAGRPIMLGLILTGQTWDPTEVFNNHVVLAAGYAYSSSTGNANVYVYDSRDPGKVHRISLHVLGGRLNLSYSFPDPVIRGFFAMPLGSGPPKAPPASYFVPVAAAAE